MHLKQLQEKQIGKLLNSSELFIMYSKMFQCEGMIICCIQGPHLCQKNFSVRWFCNADVEQRALNILPNLKFCGRVGYQVLVTSLVDSLLGPKLAFFAYIATELEPFLTEFHTDLPMAPFLYTGLSDILKTFMSMFLNEEVMLTIDVTEKENLKFSKHVSLGYSTCAALHNANASQLQLEFFKEGCHHFLQTCTKILEKAPMKYKLCKGVSFCDPTLISKSWNLLKKRLDSFWSTLLSGFSVPDLLYFVKKVLHGNASVERRFSVNKELVVENQAQKFLVAQRQV
ncbi:hypothetical protein PR048_026773 [Dryococelus australis]|uniref:Uncharacterized protein n=1 Tax=Dryococelus australis TaxID=614101 RepID=A0ABQ9GM93_9NEOP|nr:hypothetical protein PR048_026773 [Dryococelus australis]